MSIIHTTITHLETTKTNHYIHTTSSHHINISKSQYHGLHPNQKILVSNDGKQIITTITHRQP